MTEFDPGSQLPTGNDPAAPATAEPSARPAEARRENPRPSGWGMLMLGLVFGGASVAVLVTLIALIAAGSGRSYRSALDIAKDRVAVLPLEGEILDSKATIDRLTEFADNESVKAIVVRINSPGGSVAASQEIHREIRRVREESSKPVVASLDTVAASGGYYVAVGCDSIVANPGSITGSIGVIAQWFNVEKLVEWAKLSPETITSGTMKDAGSPYRQMSDGERDYFQRIVRQLHEQFVAAVVEGRAGKMTEKQIREIADGRVFTGQEASQMKLVDQLGGLEDAIRLAGSMAGIDGKPVVIYPREEKRTFLEMLGESRVRTDGIVERILAGRGSPFLYRW